MALIGAHVDTREAIAQARARGANAAQIFLGDPKGWKAPVVDFDGGAPALKEAAAAAGVTLFVHAPYVLNVASLNNRIRIPSRKQLQKHVDLAAEIGAVGVVVHGGHVRSGEDEDVGFDNWRKAVDALDAAVPIFIENTAGGQNAMARGVAKLTRLWEAVRSAEGGDRVGFCLDTCHAYAGGEELAGLVPRIMAAIGRIDLVHVNDSRDPFDSGADRHANLGEGSLPQEELAGLVRAAAAPMIVETPGGQDAQARDIAWLQERCG